MRAMIRDHTGFLRVMAFALLAASCVRPEAPKASSTTPLLARTVPDFRRPLITGAGRFDTRDMRGRVLVVTFFGRYCEPCRETLPMVEAAHRRLPEVAFVGITVDELASDGLAMAQGANVSFPVVHDGEGALRGRWRVRSLPATFVVDPGGFVTWAAGDPDTERGLAAAIEAAKK